MSTAITSVVATMTLTNVNANLFANQAIFTPDGSKVLFGARQLLQAGAIYQVPTASFADANCTVLYPAGFFGGDINGMWLSPDGTKIWTWQQSTSTIRSANIDGSSPSATVEWTSISLSAGTQCPVYTDADGVTYVASASQRAVEKLDLVNKTKTHALSATNWMGGVGPCHFQANSIMVGHVSPGYLGVWRKDSGHVRILAGNGGTSAITAGGSAYSVSMDRIDRIASDEDGRVYFVSNSRLWSLIGGTVAQIGAATNIVGMDHSLSQNKMVAGSGASWVLYG